MWATCLRVTPTPVALASRRLLRSKQQPSPNSPSDSKIQMSRFIYSQKQQGLPGRTPNLIRRCSHPRPHRPVRHPPQNLRKLPRHRPPTIILLHQFPRRIAKRMPQIRIAQHRNHPPSKIRRPVSNHNVLPVSHRQPLSPNRSRNHRLTLSHSLKNLNPRPPANPQRHHINRRPIHKRPNIIHRPSNLNQRIPHRKLLHPPRRTPPHHQKPRVRNLPPDQRQNLRHKIKNPILIRHPIHRPGKNHHVRLFFPRRRPEIIHIHPSLHGSDLVP